MTYFCLINIMLLRFIQLGAVTHSYQIGRLTDIFRSVALDQPQWQYLHHGKHQSLQIRSFVFKERVVNICQHTSDFIHPLCVFGMQFSTMGQFHNVSIFLSACLSTKVIHISQYLRLVSLRYIPPKVEFLSFRLCEYPRL